MNTVRSTWFGWGTLIVAGGGAYYFAKREINADRQARHDAQMKKRERLDQMAFSRTRFEGKKQHKDGPSSHPPGSDPSASLKPPPQPVPQGRTAMEDKNGFAAEDHAGNPSSEASHDPAPTQHMPETGEQKMREKSKYEAPETWRGKKGDRFS